MNTKHWLILSLAANVVAASLLIRTSTRPPLDSKGSREPAMPSAATTDVSRVVKKTESTHEATLVVRQSAATATTNVLPVIWKQVAAADYQQFADNLRAIGVPEETVRDIVMLDLMKTLGEDMTGLARHVEKPFWQAQSTVVKSPSVSNEVAQAMAQLKDFTKQVLGIEPGDWIADRWGWVIATGNGSGDEFEALEELFAGFQNADEYTWLAPERARELQRRYAANEKKQEELEAKIAAISDRRSPEFEALQFQLSQVIQAGEKIGDLYLTSAERRERDLREDYYLQQQLAGAAVTRAEYEKLHDLARSIGAEEPPYFKPNTPEAAQAMAILGAERFAEFQRGADARYGQILQTCAQYDIPHQASQKVYEIGLAHDQRVAAGGSDANELLEQLKRELQELVPNSLQRESLAQTINAYFARH